MGLVHFRTWRERENGLTLTLKSILARYENRLDLRFCGIAGYPAEVGALFTTVSSIRVSRVGRVSRASRVMVTLTVTVRVSRASVMVSVSL